jgi:hypothetical protein
MSHEAPRKSHVMTWTITLVIAPLAYVLTIPPLLTLPSWGKNGDVPVWLALFASPYGWLVDHTPLRDPLNDYFDWWMQHANPSVPLPQPSVSY